MESLLREYIVTLYRYEDLEEFYNDMETEGGNLYIPGRAVDLAARRPISRNTHYMLSDSEAETLKNDTRVESVSLTVSELGLKVVPFVTQTSSFWDKSSTVNNTHRNWGLLRSTEGINRSNWGSNGTSSVAGTVRLTAKGKNVDVVIVDGHLNKDHPEFAKNSDGTGGSRVIQYNWFQLTNQVTGGTNGTYNYTVPVNEDNNHGNHVAGTACGNTQGWARDANIYHINPYGSSPSPISTEFLFDYIRAWHKAKTVNPATGYKNPTIMNCSFGLSYIYDVPGITQLYYRGTLVSSDATAAQLTQYGIYNNGSLWVADGRSTSIDADVVDAIKDGIIVVGASGNWRTTADIETGPDFGNYFIWVSGGISYKIPYNTGPSPGCAPGVICVGAVDSTVNDQKAIYSSRGPRVDVFAPGTNIISSVNSGTVGDSRGSSYFINKLSGTSMASPQVTGVLACLLEIYPRWKQADARAYVANTSKATQVFDTGGPLSDWYSLRGAANKYLYYRQERPESGSTWPKVNYNARPATGVAYPRFSRKI
jgi:hypothetical protein